MRELSAHKVNILNSHIAILAVDVQDHSGACHHYRVFGVKGPLDHSIKSCDFRFQNGPSEEVGLNGITNEVLLAILEDRLAGFQSGPYAHPYNAEALEHIRAAQGALAKRTMERLDRGVEGTLEV